MLEPFLVIQANITDFSGKKNIYYQIPCKKAVGLRYFKVGQSPTEELQKNLSSPVAGEIDGIYFARYGAH